MDYINLYLFYFEMQIRCVLLAATLYIVIWHGSTVYLIGNHDFISFWAWVCPPQWDNCYFPDGTSRTMVPRLTRFVRWWRLVMYFIHQMLLWPHTLGGIYYSLKFLYTCIPDIWLSYLHFFPSHHWVALLKNSFFEDVCTLHQNFLHTYDFCTTTTHICILATPLQPTYTHKCGKN